MRYHLHEWMLCVTNFGTHFFSLIKTKMFSEKTSPNKSTAHRLDGVLEISFKITSSHVSTKNMQNELNRTPSSEMKWVKIGKSFWDLHVTCLSAIIHINCEKHISISSIYWIFGSFQRNSSVLLNNNKSFLHVN